MDRKTQREWVLKLLFQINFNNSSLEDLDTIIENHELEGEEFVYDSVHSTIKNIDIIDEVISKNTNNLPINKITNIDKCILRMSVNEFVIQKSVPTSVSINEAVELSKKYSKIESYKFINGVLSAISKEYQ